MTVAETADVIPACDAVLEGRRAATGVHFTNTLEELAWWRTMSCGSWCRGEREGGRKGDEGGHIRHERRIRTCLSKNTWDERNGTQ